MNKSCFSRGLTIPEILITLSILVIIITISVSSFLALNQRSALNASMSIVTSVLYEARFKTLAGYSGTRYGVHFASSSVTLFSGSVYDQNDASNVTSPIDSRVIISNVTLAPGGLDIIFNRLTGETSQPGTITFSAVDGTTKILTVYGTGIVE